MTWRDVQENIDAYQLKVMIALLYCTLTLSGIRTNRRLQLMAFSVTYKALKYSYNPP